MARRIVQGPIRNKEKTKQKLIDAVGTLLKEKGHAEVKVNILADTAGVNKRLIYEYFGGIDGVIDAYIKQQDYWKTLKDHDPADYTDHGKQYALNIVQGLFDQMQGNEALQKMILWELSEFRQTLRDNTDQREADGNQIFETVMDPYFKEHAPRFRAVMAMLISSAYYMNIHTDVNGSTFCGLDLKTEKDRNEIKDAMAFVLEKLYESK